MKKITKLLSLLVLMTLGTASAWADDVASVTVDGTTTNYTSFTDAVNAASAGETITMLQDITISSQVTIGKAITLDLNGHTISGEKQRMGYYMLYFHYTDGNATIKNGTITGDVYALKVGGNLTIDSDVTVQNTYDSSSDDIGSPLDVLSGTVNVYGTLSGIGYGINFYDGTANIYSGATVTGRISAIFGIRGTCNVYGGTLGVTTRSESDTFEQNTIWANDDLNVNVYGGTITGIKRAVYVQNESVNIYGGTFTGPVAVAKSQTKFITSGLFSEEPNSDFLATGSTMVQDGGMYRVYLSELHITDASELTGFATHVNQGIDFSNASVYLDNDIDMSGVTNYTPIGTESHPFSGTFDGQVHRIKNLIISQSGQYKGLFGYVNGTNTVIKNTIIDASCSITSTGTTSDDGAAVAGVVAGVNSSSGTTCNVTIENCGNEATITGYSNVAGILGGSYANDNNVITINNCYNTGAITGNKESAAICGYSRQNYTITNCYNSGTVTGGTDDQHFYRPKSGGTTSVKNCYDTGGYQVVNITAAQIASGELCFLLNGSKAAGVWGHTSEDAYPVLSGAGMQHYSRTMTNQWGTICLPFAVEPGSDYDFYELSEVTRDALTLKKIESTLEAGTPAIVRRNAEATGIDLNASNTTFVENPITGSDDNGLTLTGKFTKEQITGSHGYIIANNAFWKITEIQGTNSVYCLPFHAYLAGDLLLGAKMLTIGFGNDVTGINNLDADVNADANLNGKFLINGKLIIIKNGKEYNANGQLTK